MQLENILSQDQEESLEEETLFSSNYDQIDYKHAEILEKCATMCRSKKSGFTETDRIDAIREILKDSEYEENYINTASIWMKKEIAEKILQENDFINEPFFVISTHADTVSSIQSCYSKLDDHGYYKGTYDNAGTNAAAVISMLEADFPDNVIFTFTADEETGRCQGARDTVAFLEERLGLKNVTYIALDVTYEGYAEGHLATIENAPKKNPEFLHTITEAMLKTEPKQTMTYVRKSKKAIPDNLPKEYMSPDTGWMDEAFIYSDLGKNTFSLCLPCDGDMHGQNGVTVRQPTFEGYLATLQGMMYDFTKTHEDLIINKKIEKATLFERSLELVEKEKQEEAKRRQSYTSYSYSGNNFLENYRLNGYYDDYENYDDEEEYTYDPDDYLADDFVMETLGSLASYYDSEEVSIFAEDAIAQIDPDLYHRFMSMKASFCEYFENYLSYKENSYEPAYESNKDGIEGYEEDSYDLDFND